MSADSTIEIAVEGNGVQPGWVAFRDLENVITLWRKATAATADCERDADVFLKQVRDGRYACQLTAGQDLLQRLPNGLRDTGWRRRRFLSRR